MKKIAWQLVLLLPILLWLTFFTVGVMKTAKTVNKDPTTLPFNDKKDAFGRILKNNIFVVGGNCLGFSTAGIGCLASASGNGYIMGVWVALAIQVDTPTHKIVANILPHGITEVPALWMSCSARLLATIMLIQFMRGHPFPKQEIIAYIALVVASFLLTAIAAYIEAFYTLAPYF